MKNDTNISELTNFITIVKKARIFATKAHSGVFRNGKDDNGNNIDYITHPIAVGEILHKYKKSHEISSLVAVCMLHDTVEDCDTITIDLIREEFGVLIASLVEELTSDPKGIEKYGKEQYLINKMTSMSSWALTIKLSDRIHNVSDMKKRFESDKLSDVKWAIKYTTQTNNIIEALEQNRSLSNTHKILIDIIKNNIETVLTHLKN